MKKVALVFVLAVFAPSLVLAWLALRSLRDQEVVLERQQSLLYQGVADAMARDAANFLNEQQHEFGQGVEDLLALTNTTTITSQFDELLRTNWRYAEVGFVVTVAGNLLSPSPTARPAAAEFCAGFGKFLGNQESAQVYYNAKVVEANGPGTPNGDNNFRQNVVNASSWDTAGKGYVNPSANQARQAVQPQAQPPIPKDVPALVPNGQGDINQRNGMSQAGNSLQLRSVMPSKSVASPQQNEGQVYSKVAPAEAEFRQLVGDSGDGMVARFVENKLNVLMWHRSLRETNLIFGAQLSLPRVKEALGAIPANLDPALRGDMAVALLDDMAKPVAVFPKGFQANWKHPFVATEIGEALPHWELAAYLLNPEKLARSAQVLKLTLGLLIAVLLAAIGVGGWLIVADLKRQLTLARQKTDFVSNVSHELKTPLTSIRMFSELLAENRVAEPGKRQTYLNIITAETARLTRLINNVLDFSRMERGEKKYNFQHCNLAGVIRETVETYRPHLESNGFKVEADWPEAEICVNGDRDALAQVVVNLLSNAEKYSNGGKEIRIEVMRMREPLPHAEVRVLDRGTGVPAGSEEKVFEKFYRAHDSLGSGIQGSGLGLTLARQIARAHGGDVVCHPREGGGSCFILRLPTRDNELKTGVNA